MLWLRSILVRVALATFLCANGYVFQASSAATRPSLVRLFAAPQPFRVQDANDARHVRIQSTLATINQLNTDESPSSFFKKLDKSVEAKPSAIAGMGLFAKKNIKSGSIISLYPIHAVGVDFQDDDSSVCIASNPVDQAYFDDESASVVKSDNNYLQYLLGSRPLGGKSTDSSTKELLFGDDALFIDVNPNKAVHTGWKSHFVNDGAVVETRDEAGVLEYYAASKSKKNCVHVPFAASPILATVATRKIKAGEELFTTYGGSYWWDVLAPLSDDAELEVTEAIQEQSMETARDIYTSMQAIMVTYQTEAERL